MTFEEIVEQRKAGAQALVRQKRLQDIGTATAPILRAFFEQSDEAMYVTTVAGQFYEVNRAFARMLGYSIDELKRLPVSQIYSVPGERRRFRAEIDAGGRVHNFALQLKTRGGQTQSFALDAVVWRRESGEVGGYIGTVRPERRRPDRRPPSAPFDLAIRGSNDGLWSWRPSTDELDLSSRWKALLGFSDYEFADSMRSWLARIHPQDSQRFRSGLKAVAQRQADLLSVYLRMQGRDGVYRWVMVRGISERDTSGRLVRIAGSLSDITAHLSVIERYKLQQSELSAQNQRLAAERSALSRFFTPQTAAAILERSDDGGMPCAKAEIAILSVRFLGLEDALDAVSAHRYRELTDELVTDVMDLVYGLGGSVPSILGDRLLVTFGLPDPTGDDARAALRSAWGVRSYIDTYNDVRPEDMPHPVGIAIGVAHGEVFAGAIGSIHRLEYTVAGAAVNVAQELATRAAASGEAILCDRRIVGALAGELVTRTIGDAYAVYGWSTD